MMGSIRHIRFIQFILVFLLGFLNACGPTSSRFVEEEAAREEWTEFHSPSTGGNNLLPEESGLTLYAATVFEIPFKDLALKQCVLEQGNKKPEEIYYLTCGHRGIKDLTGLENLTQLRQFIAPHNQIQHLEPLKQLKELFYLELNHNQITDISPLQGLTALSDIILNDNQIVSVGPLSGLKEIKRLDLHNNQIEEICALGNLSNLEYLTLMDNQIVFVNALARIHSLKYFHLNNNPLHCHSFSQLIQSVGEFKVTPKYSNDSGVCTWYFGLADPCSGSKI